MDVSHLSRSLLLGCVLALAALTANVSTAVAADPQVPLYGLFEVVITNATPYENPFADVELNATFTSPSGQLVVMPGFHDGDGQGGVAGVV